MFEIIIEFFIHIRKKKNSKIIFVVILIAAVAITLSVLRVSSLFN